MKRTALPPRTAPMPRRTTRLAPESPKRRAARVAQGKAYAGAADAEQGWCECCKVGGEVHHSHLLTQGNHKQHRANELNWLMMCWGCHCLWEHKKQQFAARFPETWALIQDRILLVGGPQALAFFLLKNPY